MRQIWGRSDTVLFIFAGSAAEFALNKAVDWLYFTGRLPADPLGRLFSTVSYAHGIIFARVPDAYRTIDSINKIHGAVEENRGARIPDWAYRDVLFMLIDYSIRSFELVDRKLTLEEKREVFDVFYRQGTRMGLQGLPQSYEQWLAMRQQHMEQDLQRSPYTDDLFKQYRKHLGAARYRVLLECQMLVVPPTVGRMLGFRRYSLLAPGVIPYRMARRLRLDRLLQTLIVPPKYRKQVQAIDRPPEQ